VEVKSIAGSTLGQPCATCTPCPVDPDRTRRLVELAGMLR
jgi:hypothetical protein